MLLVSEKYVWPFKEFGLLANGHKKDGILRESKSALSLPRDENSLATQKDASDFAPRPPLRPL